MKPLQLELAAFGAYPNHQTLDFTPLIDGRLFVIHGQTGAGKTTLFDAICYALYGQASAEGRDKDSLRSHHAEQGVMPFVRFRFSVGTEEYEIERTLPFWKPKNKNSTPAKVVLRHLSSGKIWEKDADEQVLMLLGGMKAEQFRQVIVLPQGEFQQFLKASTDKRRDILKVLFQTQIYSRVEELLKQHAAEIKLRYDEQKKILERLFTETLPSQNSDEYILTKVMEEILRLQAEENRLNEQIPLHKAARDEAKEQVRIAEERQKLAISVEDIQREMMRHDEQAQSIEAQQLRLQKSREAERVEPRYQALQQAEAQQKLRLDNHAELQRHASKAANVLQTAQKLKSQADASAFRLNELADEIARWNALRPNVMRLAEIEGQVVKTRKACLDAEKARDSVKSALRKAEEEMQIRQNSLPGLSTQAAEKQALKAELERWNSIERAQTTLREEREKFKTIKTKAGETLKKEQEEASKRDTAQKAFEEIEQEWRKGQAARLAITLKDDEPCPVCGSRSHPHKAHQISDNGIISDADYDIAKVRKETAEKAHQIVHDEVVRLNSELDTVKKQGEIRKKSYEADFGADFALSPEECLQKKHDTQQKINAAISAETKIQAAEKDLERLVKEKDRLIEQLERAEETLQNARNEDTSAQSELKILRDSLPEKSISLKDLDARIEAIQKEQKEIQTALEKAEKDVRDAEFAQTQVQARLKALLEEIHSAEENIEQERTVFLQNLTESGFAGVDAFSNALLLHKEQDALHKSIEEWRQKGVELASQHKERLERFGGEVAYREYIKPEAQPNLTLMTINAEKAEQVWEELLSAKERTALDLERLTSKLKEIRQGLQELEKLECELIPAQMLAKTANGDNPFKMRFQDYVLTALLDEIIASANLRLRTISSGRYALDRKIASEDRRKAEMLDFDVIDFHTGAKRNARTLSGGETFFTSLALALGLADVVAMRSGGIRMDALFIDEGFGSLDAETLDIALDTLTSLQSGGRLVGVISHVSELKERIPTRLEIIKTAQGSQIGVWQGV